MAEIVGHRGASHDAPENTLPSVKLGFEQGADAVEVDVFATADGRIVAIHDPNCRRWESRELRPTALDICGSSWDCDAR